MDDGPLPAANGRLPKLLRVSGILAATLAIAAVLVWQGIAAAGNPDPTAPGTTLASGSLDIAVLVFREGLESILVLAAILAGLRAKKQVYRRSIYAGMGVGFGAGVASWFVAISAVSALTASYGALAIQAATGLVAVAVLLVVMNWFFHNVYWSGWISMHNRRKQALISQGDDRALGGRVSGVLLGLGALGFASVYRESVEIVLFLQSYYLQLGSLPVYYGAAGGLVLTAAAGWLTLVENSRLPYKKMLVATGVLLTGVLFVMVGEQVNEMQLAGWVGTTNISWLQGVPGWAGTWFSIFPNLQTFVGQALAVLVVAGSYLIHRFRTYGGWNPSLPATGMSTGTLQASRPSPSESKGE
ncbi:MAG TPA: FTR1 family protein [Nitrososphaerales archaeon]|nr:FTR1 family protein [Nitrososphaerales archaeon]